jgi:hypothetical protein
MRPLAKQENIREGARRPLSPQYLPRRAQTGANTDCYQASEPDSGRDCDRSPKFADRAATGQRREERVGSLTQSQLSLAEQLTGYFNCLRLHSIGDSIHMETCKLRSYAICTLAKNKHRYMRSNHTAKGKRHSYKHSRICLFCLWSLLHSAPVRWSSVRNSLVQGPCQFGMLPIRVWVPQCLS